MRWRFDEFMTGNINQAVLYSFTYQEDSFVSFAMQYPNSKLFTFIFWSTQTKKILRYLLGPYSVSHHRTIQALETSPLTPGSASNPRAQEFARSKKQKQDASRDAKQEGAYLSRGRPSLYSLLID